MGFCIYRSSVGSDGKVKLSDREVIKLSGSSGFVAAYVQNIKGKSENDWQLTQQELADFLKKDGNSYAILFEIPKENVIGNNIYALVKVLGRVKGDKTEVMVHMAGVHVLETGTLGVLELKEDLSDRKLFEQLTLMGSFSGGSWRLAEPDNSLTAAVVGAPKS